MVDYLRMGLKPLNHFYFTYPFTEVNGNIYNNSNSVGYLLPSALADGFYKSLLSKALATFQFVSAKCLIQYGFFASMELRKKRATTLVYFNSNS
jgi:hypothetical protein